MDLLAMESSVASYGPVVFLIVVAIVLATVMMIVTHWPTKYRRHGAVKDTPYESGMEPIGDARGRFNVRFYLVAMLFLLFDVELIFLYPWARVFFDSATGSGGGAIAGAGKSFLLWEMVVFLAILMVGYVYAWRRGIFRWD
ncbi:MAG: NADH-quinone oxidoreductase subunit A [Phycisphaerae bacterium]